MNIYDFKKCTGVDIIYLPTYDGNCANPEKKII